MILSTHLFCLLYLSTTPQLCPSLLLSYTFDVLDHIHQHNQPNTIHYLLCTIDYTYISTTNQILFTIYYARLTIHYALCTMHYALYTMHHALYTMHYALCIIYYALCTMHYTLCTIHYALCIRIYTYLLFYMYSYIFIRIHYLTWKSDEIQ